MKTNVILVCFLWTQSEYVAPHFQRRQYISGFTGSNGKS